MIINSLKLKNIRSYLDEEIKFPNGSTMLSGDIGTGKTSILLSIEFALFGIIRGQVSGSTLLRHGSKEGFVELNFLIDGKDIIIRRSLKRSSKSVNQDSGYIIINGVKEDLSPVELKSKVLELIGYPDELLTKSKSFIFRYTVYTPQEEMKHILFESKDERLNILRRIFDIDKYKRIKDNALNYIKALKIRRTALETRIEDLEEKKIGLKEYDEKISSLKKNISKVEAQLKEVQDFLQKKESIFNDFEEKIKLVESLRNNIELKINNINSKKSLIKSNEEEIKSLEEQLSILKKELSELELIDLEKLKKEKEAMDSKKKSLQDNLDKINDRNSKFIVMKDQSENLMNKILSLDECPVCQQRVDSTHKDHVKGVEGEKISGLKEQLEKLSNLKYNREKDLNSISEKIESINQKIRRFEILSVKKERFDDYGKKKLKIQSEQTKLKSDVEKEEFELSKLKIRVDSMHDIQKKALEAKQELEESRAKAKSVEITKAEISKEIETIDTVRKNLLDEVLKKEESKKELASINELQDWIIKYFLNIVYLMEKQIMLHVHYEFNEYFQEWFNILIEDENLNVRLDESFTPIIEQNGYETYIENLSGGERTSVALAYRLSLNKVINDFIGTIKTKDLLILDEPTDGFSSEQLDKIRELLEQIKVKQVILVSHEPKLESYVDYIVRIHKEEHISRVLT